jgi:hypothetical protein
MEERVQLAACFKPVRCLMLSVRVSLLDASPEVGHTQHDKTLCFCGHASWQKSCINPIGHCSRLGSQNVNYNADVSALPQIKEG